MWSVSVLKKGVMALTGLAWFGFVIGHLVGNFLIFAGAESFNAYAHKLESTGVLLYIAEAALIILLSLHAITGIRLWFQNRSARGSARYEVTKTNGEASVASRTMALAGTILLVFIIAHVNMFKFGDKTGEDGLYGLVVRSFQDPLTVGLYVLCMLALGLHLSHGFGSAFQSLGLMRPSLRPKFRLAGIAFGWLIAIGFISLPIYAFLTGA
jgi:succinate dehydrogenase / fumarate reductase cytochrome b subunit